MANVHTEIPVRSIIDVPYAISSVMGHIFVVRLMDLIKIMAVEVVQTTIIIQMDWEQEVKVGTITKITITARPKGTGDMTTKITIIIIRINDDILFHYHCTGFHKIHSL